MSNRDNGVRILARSLFKQLVEEQGYDHRQVVSLATELIDQVANTLSTPPAPGELRG